MDVWIGHGGDAGRVHHSEDIRSRYMGWVLGFGIGALLMGAVVSATCALAVASISGWQGTRLLQGYRLVPTIISTVMRAMVIASVTLHIRAHGDSNIRAPVFYYAFNKATVVGHRNAFSTFKEGV